MAKKADPKSSQPVEQTSTPVRHSPSVRESRPAINEPVSKEIPPKKTAKKAEPKSEEKPAITDQMIAEAAYYISQRSGGSMDDHWREAERSLRGES